MPRLSLILAACVACAYAADPVPVPRPVPVVPVAETVAAPPPRDDAQVAELRAKLPQVAWIVERDGRLWWQGSAPEQAVAFTGIDDRDQPLVETAAGAIAVQRRLLASERRDALTALLALAPLAKAAGITGLRLAEGPLTGLHLHNADVVVLPDGVLSKAEPPAGDRSGEIATLKEAVATLNAALPKVDMDGPARRALGLVLGKLTSVEPNSAIDDASPDFLRRVVRSGWLRQFFPTIDSDDRIEQAVRAAERPAPIRLWRGSGGELAEVRDAFGRGGWTLRSPSRSAWLVDHATPIYFGNMPPMVLVVEVAPGSDPSAADARSGVRSARLWRQADGDYEPLALWTPGKALECEATAWDRAVPRRNRSPNVENWLPAHILVTDLRGDVLALAASTGSVTPPRDASPVEGERFLSEAARALPDAAHLDLLGQHLLRYVYDSPDPRRPNLIGSKQDKGDIHQTALQTLATVAGGMVRGDCDDAAELYQTISERQGRTAHVISLPGHAACAWAEKRADAWHVFVLQTGPALEFTDADPRQGLQNALAKTYKHFDESDAFDPNGLGLLLRFSNENQRGSWRLSYRIFEDPEYARIMIDVQKDWHYSTYQRGIVTMEKMVQQPAESAETANFRELSGLYSFTGQYAKAADAHLKAIELTTANPLSALYMDAELIGHLFAAGRDQRAREVALELLDKQIPAQKQALGQSLMQVGMQLATALKDHKSRDLALRALRPALAMLNDRITETMGRRAAKAPHADVEANPVAGLQALGDWLEGPDFDEGVWENHPAMQQFRRLSLMLAGTAINVLEGSTAEERLADADLQLCARFVQVWLDRVAFRDVDDPGEAMFRYSTAGDLYATLLGETQFAALIDAAPKPVSLDGAPLRRVGGIAQVAMDAGWVRICTPYWTGKLMQLFSRDREDFDAALASRLAKRAIEAAKLIAGTPLEHPRINLQAHLATVIGALIDRDEATLRACLRTVAQRNDKDLRDDTAQWLGDCARRLPLDWYAQVLKCWDEEVGPTASEPQRGKQKYFWIAWRAALGKAPQHALMAAELAAKRFPDDPAFAEEFQFMRTLLAAPKPK